MAIKTLVRKAVASNELTMMEGIVIAAALIFCHDVFVKCEHAAFVDTFIRRYGEETYRMLMDTVE